MKWNVVWLFLPGLLVTLFGVTSCVAPSETATGTAQPERIASSEELWSESPFELLQAQIVGDSLVVNVQYSGGCASHDWALESAGPMMKSLPPKQMLRLVHRTADDPCRALVVERHAFDVRPWRGTPRGVTVLLLENWKEPLNYAYD